MLQAVESEGCREEVSSQLQMGLTDAYGEVQGTRDVWSGVQATPRRVMSLLLWDQHCLLLTAATSLKCSLVWCLMGVQAGTGRVRGGVEVG